MNPTYDVALVGGGVAGSTLAGTLAEAGLGVIVVEREGRFRDRVRGESIHPWGVAEATRLGLLPALRAAGANDLPVWQAYVDRHPVEPYHWADDSIDGLPEVAVSHPRLQTVLLERAAALGARVLRPARVVALHRNPTPEIEIATEAGSARVRARLIVGADGRTSAVRTWIGARMERDPDHHLIGGGLIAGVRLAPDAAHAATFAGGRIFVFPWGDGHARAYVIANAGRAAPVRADHSGAAFVRFCGDLMPEGGFSGAARAGPVAFFPNADTWSSRIAGDGVALIGDAAGANDPSLGQGLALVFRDARQLRDLLLDGDDWRAAIGEFEIRRRRSFDVLRAYGRWMGILVTEEGPEADACREQVARARQSDPTAGGFGNIFALGPDGLVADEAARRRFFGERTAAHHHPG